MDVLAEEENPFDGPESSCNFLLFCAQAGYYNQLPEKFKTPEYILQKSSWARYTPLHLAAIHKHLDKFPVECLQKGDLTRHCLNGSKFQDTSFDILYQAACNEQVELIEHAVDTDYISGDAIGACFRIGYFPSIIMNNLTTRNMLEPTFDILKPSVTKTALADAAYYGHLGKVSSLLFIGSEYKKARDEVSNRPKPKVCSKKAEKWLLKVSHEKLEAAAKKCRSA